MTGTGELRFARDRVTALLEVLERMAAGDLDQRLPTSPAHDELDAVAYAVNILVGEMAWASTCALEEQQRKAEELREAVAEARRANAAKGVFLRNVSHEIRTPIAAMLGFAELLATPDLPPADRTDLVHRLQSNGQAVLAVIGDLLDLARLDADRVVLTPEQVSIPELLRDVIGSMEIETTAKQLDVRLVIEDDTPSSVTTDRHRLRQILVNLFTNAVKFTDAGSIVVSTRGNGAVDQRLTIDVMDTGIGIPTDRHALIFEPFEQVDSTITRRYGGTGLGLALAHRLAEQLGGSLMLLRSEPGAGSTFRLTLNDIRDAPVPQGDAVPERPAAPARVLSGLRILLADDHPDVHRALRRLLEHSGALVESAADGREAVAKARSGTFDVVLMDLRMPDMDGLEATRMLRAEGCSVPIIAMSADPANRRRADALSGGCDACIFKPFSLSDLTEAILGLVDRRQVKVAGA